jgi:CubicO group peptidase (beta-lactamase class C family)
MRHRIALLLFLCLPLSSFAQQKPGITPDRVNAALTQLDAYIRSSMEKTKVPGTAVAVVYNDQVVFLRGYGVRKIGEPAKIDPDTVFELASVSKPLASSVLAALVGQGQVNWDDKVADLMPGFQLSSPITSREVTIRDFFSHRSGLATESGDYLEDLGYSRPEIVHRMRYLPLPGTFRKTYAYSNFGLTAGAIAAATKIGKPWEVIAEKQLFQPLGMTSTSYRFSDYENHGNKAALHVMIDGQPVNRFVRDADAEASAGGASSNARDLAQWVRLQLDGGKWNGKQLIDAGALAETHKPQVCRVPADPAKPDACPGDQYYGLGWNVGKDEDGSAQFSHSGAFFLGASTAVYIIPEEHIGILALTNAWPVGLPESICLTFIDYAHGGKARRDYLPLIGQMMQQMITEAQNAVPNYAALPPPKSPTAARPLSDYVGTYTNEYFGTLQVSIENNLLILRLPPRGAYYQLTHWDADTFSYYYASENSSRGGAKFFPDKHQVVIENLAPEHNAVFTRTQPSAAP